MDQTDRPPLGSNRMLKEDKLEYKPTLYLHLLQLDHHRIRVVLPKQLTAKLRMLSLKHPKIQKLALDIMSQI